MAGGLNDLELETETLDEVCLSPLPTARCRPVMMVTCATVPPKHQNL